MPLYFAYGSNMERDSMVGRCPHSGPVGVARLVRHRFIVSTDGYASVVRDPRRTVWGILWDLALADVPALDRYESLSTGLYAKVVQPVLTAKGPRRAMIYVGRSARPGVPKEGYLAGIVAAAREAGLPQDYVRELESWDPALRSTAPTERPAVRPLWSAPAGIRGVPRGLQDS